MKTLVLVTVVATLVAMVSLVTGRNSGPEKTEARSEREECFTDKEGLECYVEGLGDIRTVSIDTDRKGR